MSQPVIVNHRLVAPVGVVVLALFGVGCSATRQQVESDGDVVLRSGPTALGWLGIGAVTIFFAVFLAFFVVVLLGIIGGEVVDAVSDGQFLPAAGMLLAFLFAAGVVGGMGWGVASYSVLRYHTTEATASRSAQELSVTRSRIFGGDEVRRWGYGEIDGIEFEYVPGTSGDGGSPPQGVVKVRTNDDERATIFDGSPCPARDLAEAVTSATGVPIEVEAGPRDLSSWTSLTTQLRCGVAQPFRPEGWRDYPGEASRVLDLPSLWRWPLFLPFLASQLLLLAALWIVDKRWLEPKAPTPLRVAVWVAIVLTAAALHWLAALDYGSWPAALAALTLVWATVGARRLGFTLSAFLRDWRTST